MAEKYLLVVLMGGIIGIASLIAFGSDFQSTVFGIAAPSLVAQSSLIGHLEVTATDPDGNLIAYRQTDNIVVNKGIDCIQKLVFGATQPTCAASGVFNQIAVADSGGTGCPTPGFDVTDINIKGTQRDIATATVTGASASGGTATVQLESTDTLTVTSALDVDNSGVFDAASGGNMLAGQCFTVISLLADSTMDVTWNFDLS